MVHRGQQAADAAPATTNQARARTAVHVMKPPAARQFPATTPPVVMKLAVFPTAIRAILGKAAPPMVGMRPARKTDPMLARQRAPISVRTTVPMLGPPAAPKHGLLLVVGPKHPLLIPRSKAWSINWSAAIAAPGPVAAQNN